MDFPAFYNKLVIYPEQTNSVTYKLINWEIEVQNHNVYFMDLKFLVPILSTIFSNSQ